MSYTIMETARELLYRLVVQMTGDSDETGLSATYVPVVFEICASAGQELLDPRACKMEFGGSSNLCGSAHSVRRMTS